MIYSGAELIRTSGQQAERMERLKVVDPIAPVAAPTPSGTSLDDETHSALRRFARFVKDDREAPKRAKKTGRGKGPPNAYQAQIEIEERFQDLGSSLDIYI
jgi:hypothetical protein